MQNGDDGVALREANYNIVITPRRKEVIYMAKSTYKPGQTTPKSGQYGIVGPKGGKTGQEVTAVEGKPLPPTPKPGQSFTLVDVTKHKDGK